MKKFFAIIGGLVALAAVAGGVLLFLKKRGIIEFECEECDDVIDDIDGFLADKEKDAKKFGKKAEKEFEKTVDEVKSKVEDVKESLDEIKF